MKRTIARALDWHVREQVEFNRGVMNCVQATLEALTETNRSISMLSGILEEAQQLKDIRVHWAQWREQWDKNLSASHISLLRSLSDLQGAWQHRVTLLDETHRELLRDNLQALRASFETAMARSTEEIQRRLWADMDKIRAEYETIIHAELRLLRQKSSLLQQGAQIAAHAGPPSDSLATLDWLKFAEKFRGDEEYVKRHLRIYADRFSGLSDVLDIGCGRGELLEVFREANISARGIDLNDDCIGMCRAKGLTVEKTDLFEFLAGQADRSLGGVVCLQVVEHLPPARLPELVSLVHAKLKAGGLFAIETPNPECLAIFATHFFLDPTHAKPIPPALAAFYLEEAGFGRLETLRLEPAIDSMPSLAALPEDFRQQFFGSLDYALFGRKLD